MHQNHDAQYLHHLTQITFEPIFILGLHRSGTSILYKLLAQTNRYNIITAYHLIAYHTLLSNHITKKETRSKQTLTEQMHLQSADRGIDRLKLDADFPEEYGFRLGAKSSDMKITRKNAKYFTELCKKCQYIAENNKPLLLKNPYDFPNFLLIKKLYPHARFIFIHRHPYKTLSSTIKSVQLIFSKQNWYTSQLFRMYNKTYENPLLLMMAQIFFIHISLFGTLYLIHQMRNATSYYLHNITRLPEEDYIDITYESLCTNADDTLQSIQQFLGFNKKYKTTFQSQIHERKTTLAPSVKQLKPFIYYYLKPYFKHWKYTPKGL